MDINQASQMISWLDEEFRRQKTLVTELRQKVESQIVEITDQTKRVQELESRLAATQAKLSRFNTLEQSIQQLKDEMILMLREQEESLLRYQRDQNKGRQLEQESISRALNEFKRSLEAIPPLQERLTILRAEDQRLGEQLLNLQTRVTAHERQTSQLPDRITYVEGQRAQDVKTVTQIQEEIVELLRRTEHLAGKQELVDDLSRKNEQRINALSTFREDLTKRQAQFIEDLRIKDTQRDRILQDWQVEITRFEEEMVKQRKQMERFTRQQEDSQQYLVAIEEYKQMLNREQQQLAEHQRMAEERQRRELEEWVAVNEQRWTKFRLERESQWHQQEHRNEELVSRIKQLEEWRAEDIERVKQISKELVLIREEYRSKLRELWLIHERAAVFQLDQTRRWYDEIHGTVAEKTEGGN